MPKVCMADGRKYASPRGTYGPGEIVEVPEAEAKALVNGGYAERVTDLPRYEPEPAPEETPAPPTRQRTKETTSSKAARKRERAVETE